MLSTACRISGSLACVRQGVDVEIRNGQVLLTPVRIQRADAVRATLAELKLFDQDVADAVAWARKAPRKPANRKKI